MVLLQVVVARLQARLLGGLIQVHGVPLVRLRVALLGLLVLALVPVVVLARLRAGLVRVPLVLWARLPLRVVLLVLLAVLWARLPLRVVLLVLLGVVSARLRVVLLVMLAVLWGRLQLRVGLLVTLVVVSARLLQVGLLVMLVVVSARLLQVLLLATLAVVPARLLGVGLLGARLLVQNQMMRDRQQAPWPDLLRQAPGPPVSLSVPAGRLLLPGPALLRATATQQPLALAMAIPMVLVTVQGSVGLWLVTLLPRPLLAPLTRLLS